MSLLSIPSRILGLAKSAVLRLPGIKRLRPQADPDDKTKHTYKSRINTFTQAKVDDDEMTFDIAPKIQTLGLIKEFSTQSPDIETGTDSFTEIVAEHIYPEKMDGMQKIKYNETALTDECNTYINNREQDYMRRIDAIRIVGVRASAPGGSRR